MAWSEHEDRKLVRRIQNGDKEYETLRRWILELPDKQREAILLYYFHGFKAR